MVNILSISTKRETTSLLISLNTNKTMTHTDRNPCPNLGQEKTNKTMTRTDRNPCPNLGQEKTVDTLNLIMELKNS